MSARTSFLKPLGLAVAIAWLPGAARGQEPSGELVGTALLAGELVPLADVRVGIVGTELSALSDSSGSFHIEEVPAGDHQLSVRYLNMVSDGTGAVLVRVAENATTWVEIVLEVNVVPVPELIVEIEPADDFRGKMAGFDRRRTTAFGSFITRDEIEARGPQRLSQLFLGVPGVRVVPSPDNTLGTALVSTRSGAPCFMQYYLDGVRQPPGGLYILDLIPPADVEGIEVYVGTSRTPAVFSHRTDRCGTVAIWTRDPSRR